MCNFFFIVEQLIYTFVQKVIEIMSEKQQSDTLSSTSSTKIVKNSLLSAAVTGLTFDDFAHNAVLLPATPIVQVASVAAAVLPDGE